MKKCEFCNSDFIPRTETQVYCSNNGKCRRAASLERCHPDTKRDARNRRRLAALSKFSPQPDLEARIENLENLIAALLQNRDIVIRKNGVKTSQDASRHLYK